MAWIESHQELERHPKVLKLMSLTGDTLDTTLGKLHRFWWWCLMYAEDGDLRKYDVKQISSLLVFDTQKLIDSGWIDTKPFLRVHSWYEYTHRFLYSKYKNYPEKIKRIQEIYKVTPKASPKGREFVPKAILPNQPNQPNQREKAQEVLDYFNKTNEKNLSLTPQREKIILARLSTASLEDVFRAVLNFSKDPWPDRAKYCDLVYAIGTRNGVDNFDKWVNAQVKTEVKSNLKSLTEI